MSNRLDPDQAQRFVKPDLGPNCLQRLSADDTRSRVNGSFYTYAIKTKILLFSLGYFCPNNITSFTIIGSTVAQW